MTAEKEKQRIAVPRKALEEVLRHLIADDSSIKDLQAGYRLGLDLHNPIRELLDYQATAPETDPIDRLQEIIRKQEEDLNHLLKVNDELLSLKRLSLNGEKTLPFRDGVYLFIDHITTDEQAKFKLISVSVKDECLQFTSPNNALARVLIKEDQLHTINGSWYGPFEG